jgi:2-polyprenyl-3-methyl-5-hydroxy-6-metoxy-1,4-benzoquinol methylase
MTITNQPTLPAPTPEEIDAFVGRFATDLAAVLHGATVVIGDKLGLYTALAQRGPSTAAELAETTGCDERFLHEWLCAQAAAQYAHYDETTGRFHLDPAQATCLGDETSPAFLAGGMAVASSIHKDEAVVLDAFRTGAGVGWHQHHEDLFIGTERFFRPGYVANLTTSWIPAIDGLPARLAAGARIADIGCGHGASTILLAQSYPASRVTGFDYHEPSIAIARRRADAAGVGERARFEVKAAQDVDGDGYDLVCIFDALHDMGDPEAAARHIHSRLASDGVLMLVEPNAGDRIEDNLGLVGKVFYSASSCICTPASRAQGGTHAACLGAQAGEARLRELLTRAGFSSVRRAAETPFNIVLEARP